MKLSVPQYAAAEGITRQAAHGRLKRIGIKAKRGALIDADAVNAKLANVRNPVQAARNPSGKAKAKPVASQAGETPSDNPERASFADLLWTEKRIAIEEKKLKLDERKGKVIEVADVATEWGRMISAARSMALLMPDKLAPKVAAVPDVRECRQIIAAEVNAMLSGLSEYRPHE